MLKPPKPESKKCEKCNAWACHKPDPDGRRLCVGHSQDPVHVAKRETARAAGRYMGERLRGIPTHARPAVLAGVVDIDAAREVAREEREADKSRKRMGWDGREPPSVELKTKDDVFAFIGRCAGRLLGGGDPKEATAAAALARTALVAMGADFGGKGDGDDAPTGFTYTTPDGASVQLRGRDDPTGN